MVFKKFSNRGWIGIPAVIIACVALAGLVITGLYFLRPDLLSSLAKRSERITGLFSYYVAGRPPVLYAVMVQKNGADLRVSPGGDFEITYQDEFVISSAVSDDLPGRHITAVIEGWGTGENVLGKILKGIDMIDDVMRSDLSSRNHPTGRVFEIAVKHRDDEIGRVSIRLKMTPQDWIRRARASDDINLQIEALQKAVALNTNDPGIRKTLAGLYLRQKRLREARQQYLDVVKMIPTDAFALKQLGVIAVQNEQDAEAETYLKRALSASGTDEEVLALLGFVSAKQGQWPKAAEYFKRVLDKDAGNVSVRYQLAQAYEQLNQNDEASREYERIVSLDKQVSAAWRALGDLHMKNNRHTEAIKAYGQLVRLEPKQASAYAALGAAYGRSGQSSKEIDALKKAVHLAPQDPVIRFNLGAAYERAKRSADAAAEYRKVLKMNSDDPDAMHRLAELSMQKKNFKEALRYYETLLKKTPQDASVHAALGFVYNELQQYAKSAQSYEKAIDLGGKPQNTLHLNAAYAYGRLGREKQAVGHYEKIQPQTKETLSAAAGYYLKTKGYSRAIGLYREIVKIEPSKASSYGGLGYAYALAGQMDKAIENYLIALKYDKEDSELYAQLGEAYEKKGRYADAVEAYVSAYKLNPETRIADRIPRLRIKLLEKKSAKPDKE